MHLKAFNIFVCLQAHSLRNSDNLAGMDKLQNASLSAELNANFQARNLSAKADFVGLPPSSAPSHHGTTCAGMAKLEQSEQSREILRVWMRKKDNLYPKESTSISPQRAGE